MPVGVAGFESQHLVEIGDGCVELTLIIISATPSGVDHFSPRIELYCLCEVGDGLIIKTLRGIRAAAKIITSVQLLRGRCARLDQLGAVLDTDIGIVALTIRDHFVCGLRQRWHRNERQDQSYRYRTHPTPALAH